MNPTTCVDPLDPPVRTLDDIEREEADRIAALCASWGNESSRLTGAGSGGPCSIPSARSLNRTMETANGDRHRAARMFGVTVATLSKWMAERNVSRLWNQRKPKPVYSDRGERWDSVEECARSCGVSPAGVKDSIYTTRTFLKAGGRRFDWQPIEGVSYRKARTA